MPFIPHTETDLSEMLAAIGVERIDDLFDEIPQALRSEVPRDLPAALSEMEVLRLMRERSGGDAPLNFIGAGAYDHHIPAAVWAIATRGEFYSAYTPYQPEASQGTLQIIYEYQSMMCALTGMDISNASLYDGASALAEAVLMAVRAQRRNESRRVLMPRTVHPAYRATVRAIVEAQDIELVELPYGAASGGIDAAALAAHEGETFAAIVVPQPNFFGIYEEVDELTAWAERNGTLVIALVNPVSLALLKPPGEWGSKGADIVCGDGQPLGSPLSHGGPYFGFLCCRKEHVRQMPGRLVGRTVDADGRPGFVLTLQAREQHIRRSKATSNICTNQGLLVTAATIHMALLGAEGMERVAAQCVANTQALIERLAPLGVRPAFAGEHFHEVALRLDRGATEVAEAMAARGVVGGHALGRDYPELVDCLLVCVTETRVPADLDRYVQVLKEVLAV